MSLFDEVRFPVAISFGSVSAVARRTEVVTLASGHEERNTPWRRSRRRYDAGIGLRSIDDVHEVVDFFEARRGKLYGFRWKDWADFKSCQPTRAINPADQVIGAGDGTRLAWQLVKTYGAGVRAYAREIAKPIAASVRVAVDGVELAPEGFTVNPATGLVTLETAPDAGANITAGFEFDVPVRFDTDEIEVNLTAFEGGEVPGIPIIEVRS